MSDVYYNDMMCVIYYTFEIGGAKYHDDLILFRHARYECVNNNDIDPIFYSNAVGPLITLTATTKLRQCTD